YAVMRWLVGSGMIACGIVTDRLSRACPERKWAMAIVYCAISFALLAIGFRLSPGAPQLGLLALGMFVVAGTSGPAGAMVANLTPPSIHSPAFATLTLVNNLLGLAPGPLVTGFIADRIGLVGALQIAPLVALASAFAFAVGRFRHGDGLRRLNPLSPSAAAE
ncbi:multidrug DMT transporter permease, partial [Burkholderia thailandensis]|nr:multidrug DMT transporter permease [Burkholderia thailandensis]